MGPLPNLTAGILIAIANTSWLAVNVVCFGWGLIFCAYVSILESTRTKTTTEKIRIHGNNLLFNSPLLTFYSVEYFTALMTSLIFSNITYLIKILFW